MTEHLDKIIDILITQGYQQYGGEPVSQLEHALQCAFLAEQENVSSEMITACLLHDIGHLVHDLGENIEIDTRHDYRSLKWLKPLFGEQITEPIRLHVEAKRYLCRVDANYYHSLSSASKTSLELQGGIFTDSEALEFIQQPFASEAVQLRRWDDLAKVPHLSTPSLADYRAIVTRCMIGIR